MSLRHSRWIVVIAAVSACLLLTTGAWAQAPFSVGVFSNNVNKTPGWDQEVRIVDPGTDGNPGLCAMLYVFDQYQNMYSCCGCYVTMNGLLELSVANNLLVNTYTGTVPNSGNIKLIASLANAAFPAPCDPRAPSTVNGLVAWSTHLPGKTGSDGSVAEVKFLPAGLSSGEYNSLTQQCAGIIADGSGDGVCTGPTTSSVPFGCGY
jgi:hypothetical protein